MDSSPKGQHPLSDGPLDEMTLGAYLSVSKPRRVYRERLRSLAGVSTETALPVKASDVGIHERVTASRVCNNWAAMLIAISDG
jgi:hypothetical protein